MGKPITTSHPPIEGKIAWMRASLGWLYPCALTEDPGRDMLPHDSLSYIRELFARRGYSAATPLSDGKETQTSEEGVATSDWGNRVFVAVDS